MNFDETVLITKHTVRNKKKEKNKQQKKTSKNKPRYSETVLPNAQMHTTVLHSKYYILVLTLNITVSQFVLHYKILLYPYQYPDYSI